MYVHVKACEAAGLDPDRVRRVARRLSRAANEARALGLYVFGGAGSGTLRFDDRSGRAVGALIVAELDGAFDGGDGGDMDGPDGLLRGEP